MEDCRQFKIENSEQGWTGRLDVSVSQLPRSLPSEAHVQLGPPHDPRRLRPVKRTPMAINRMAIRKRAKVNTRVCMIYLSEPRNRRQYSRPTPSKRGLVFPQIRLLRCGGGKGLESRAVRPGPRPPRDRAPRMPSRARPQSCSSHESPKPKPDCGRLDIRCVDRWCEKSAGHHG